MQKKIVIAVIAIIIVGGAAWAISSKRPAPDSVRSKTEQNTDDVAMTQKVKAQSLKDLMAQTESQTCEYETSTESSSSEGRVFFARGMMRGDFTMVSDGQTTRTHMITKDAAVYTWIDGMNKGFKTSIDASASAQATVGQPKGMDLDEPMGYKCEPWTADDSQFELPSGVTFSAVGETLIPYQMNQPDGSPNTQADCGDCDQLTQESVREQCRKALGC